MDRDAEILLGITSYVDITVAISLLAVACQTIWAAATEIYGLFLEKLRI